MTTTGNIKVWMCVTIVLIIAIGIAAIGPISGWRMACNFDKISPGMDKTNVVEILGIPSKEQFPGESYLYSVIDGKSSIAVRYCYQNKYAIVLSRMEMWVIDFDKSGSVIDKYHYVSP